jgi:hypothetical protein
LFLKIGIDYFLKLIHDPIIMRQVLSTARVSLPRPDALATHVYGFGISLILWSQNPKERGM